MKPFSISIIIPALNEEKNIGFLLADIISEIEINKLDISKVIVISDGSTDKTDEVVKEKMLAHCYIELLRNEKRLGKIQSLANTFSKIDTDYVILFDADIRLEQNTLKYLIRDINTYQSELIGGNPVPNKPSSLFNLAEQAGMFSWNLVQGIKKSTPKSIYSAHGRILALSRSLYANLDLNKLLTPGDDQFFYICAKSFSYSKNAKVIYKLPASIEDYLKQNVRFRFAKTIEDDLIVEHEKKGVFKINNKFSILLKTILRHPYNFFVWSVLYIIGYVLFQKKKLTNDASIKEWGEVKSTK